MSSPSSAVLRVSFVYVLAVGLVRAVPMQPSMQPPEDVATTGYTTVLWSVLNDCFDSDSAVPVTVCLKSKALTALDRALSKPTLAIADGVALSARAGKAMVFDQQAEKADRAALEAAKDADQKNALLDDMLANRMDRLVSSRTIVLDGSIADQEGRKKKDKAMQQAMMMAGMMAAAVMGPMAFKVIALMAGKALLLSKIALVLSGIIALKKLFQPQQGGHESESVSHHYGRSMELDAHGMAYSGQTQ